MDANIVLHYLEVGANVGACIPVYGNKFILARFLGGLAQTVAGVSYLTIGCVGEVFIQAKILRGLNSEMWYEFRDEGFEQTKHGVLNVATAISQLVVGFFTFNLGNLFVHLYLKGNFEPFIPYRGLRLQNSYLEDSGDWGAKRRQNLY